MPSPAVTAHLALLKSTAESGVDSRPRTGAICPCCGKPAKITATRPWDHNTRVRYHRCLNPSCLLAGINQTIKSVETDR